MDKKLQKEKEMEEKKLQKQKELDEKKLQKEKEMEEKKLQKQKELDEKKLQKEKEQEEKKLQKEKELEEKKLQKEKELEEKKLQKEKEQEEKKLQKEKEQEEKKLQKEKEQEEKKQQKLEEKNTQKVDNTKSPTNELDVAKIDFEEKKVKDFIKFLKESFHKDMSFEIDMSFTGKDSFLQLNAKLMKDEFANIYKNTIFQIQKKLKEILKDNVEKDAIIDRVKLVKIEFDYSNKTQDYEISLSNGVLLIQQNYEKLVLALAKFSERLDDLLNLAIPIALRDSEKPILQYEKDLNKTFNKNIKIEVENNFDCLKKLSQKDQTSDIEKLVKQIYSLNKR
jgi:hypothetical protein